MSAAIGEVTDDVKRCEQMGAWYQDPIRELPRKVRGDVLWLLAAVQQRDEEIARLRSIHLRGCDCTTDEACAFALERDGAQARVAEFEAALREIAEEPNTAAVADATSFLRYFAREALK